jgi:hypothetical protein
MMPVSSLSIFAECLFSELRRIAEILGHGRSLGRWGNRNDQPRVLVSGRRD